MPLFQMIMHNRLRTKSNHNHIFPQHYSTFKLINKCLVQVYTTIVLIYYLQKVPVVKRYLFLLCHVPCLLSVRLLLLSAKQLKSKYQQWLLLVACV